MKHLLFCVAAICFTINMYSQNYILVGEAYSAKVSKIDLSTNTKVATLKVADSIDYTTPNVVKIALDTIHNWAFVSINLGNAISIVDLNTWTATYPPISVLGMGQHPKGIAINKTCDTLYVGTEGADGIQDSTDPLEIIKISGNTFPPTLTHVTSIQCGKQPTNVVLSHDGRYAVVSCRNQARIAVVDLKGDSIIYRYDYSNTNYEPEGLEIHPTENLVYCMTHGQNTIDILNLNNLQMVNHVSINFSGAPPQPSDGTFSPDGKLFLLSAQTSNRMYMFNTTNPYNPTQFPVTVSSGGVQPHKALYINDTIAYVPNTNNCQPIGLVSYVSTGIPFSNLGNVTGTFNGPLTMVLVKNSISEIVNYTESNDFQIYPNPYTTNTYLITSQELSNASLAIYDAQGRMIIHLNNLFGNEINIGGMNLRKGIYMCQLENNNKIFTRKILVD